MEQQNYINSVNLNKNTNFPYLVLDVVDDNSYPRNPGFQVMHWHEDLQFIAVLSGEAEVVTLEKSVLLHSGEGAFINKNVVHLVRKNGSCHYKSFVFPDFFLKFYTDCPANRIVEQWAGKENFPFFHIENREEHRKVLALLQKLSNLGRQETPFYAYEVLTMSSRSSALYCSRKVPGRRYFCISAICFCTGSARSRARSRGSEPRMKCTRFSRLFKKSILPSFLLQPLYQRGKRCVNDAFCRNKEKSP